VKHGVPAGSLLEPRGGLLAKAAFAKAAFAQGSGFHFWPAKDQACKSFAGQINARPSLMMGFFCRLHRRPHLISTLWGPQGCDKARPTCCSQLGHHTAEMLEVDTSWQTVTALYFSVLIPL
jgi:hypothetical protein